MVIWSRPERGARGPAPEHSRADIAAAAVELADHDGLAGVSMRKVAAKLGTGSASLYRYLGGRDDLIELMADTVMAEIDLAAPVSGDWAADVVALALDARQVYRRHVWLLDVLTRRTPVGPAALDYLERSLELLADAPATEGRKLETIAVISGMVTWFTWQELRVPAEPDTTRLHEYLTEATADRPRLAAALTAGAEPVRAADRLPDLLHGVLRGLVSSPG